MTSKIKFILTALGVAWAADFLFYGSDLGINFCLWVGVALAAGFGLAYSLKAPPARLTWLLALAALGFAAFSFVRAQSFTTFISVLLALACLALLAATFRHANWPFYRLVDYIRTLWPVMLSALARSPELLASKRGAPGAEGAVDLPAGESRPARRRWLPLLRGLLLAVPVVIIFAGLLSSADPIFADQLKNWFSWFDLSRISEYLFRIMYILVLAYALGGIYLHAVLPRQAEARPDPGKDWLARFLGWTESTVVMVCVNLLFAVFVVIQFRYLFGGEANISTTAYTYSEYARRGFNELVLVALLSLALYLGLAALTRMEKRAEKRWFSGLSVLLILQVLVILASAYQRLVLYENAYGWTQLRTYTHIFIAWLALLLAATIFLELTRRRHHFGLAALLFILGFGLSLGLLNVDRFIAERNIQRAEGGAELDAEYLARLTSDAVPAYIQAYLRPGQGTALKDALGAELACRAYALEDNIAEDWRAFNLSEAQAAALLHANQGSWSQYEVISLGGEAAVRVNGEDHYCRRAYQD